ncbi:glycosyltransferase involved in cell wall biosynthesis [Sphingobium sp. B11D3A]|nr:glycosyltransferase involved in cell wall biosynthesis [Sphingobium sp. B11D3A]
MPAIPPRRLFVDVSVISRFDAGTGIQRVVRSLALELIAEARAQGWELQFVAATRRRAFHRIAWSKDDCLTQPDAVEGRSGDVFVGLDYALDAVRWHRGQLAALRRNGVKFWFLVHDLLPLERPDWFGANTIVRYKAWLEIIAGVGDGFLCNSGQTEAHLCEVLRRDYGLTGGYATKVLSMGYSIKQPDSPDAADTALHRSNLSAPYFLMVGTLEPRKGHADILSAFDRLWAEGLPDALVFVGRKGWQVDELSNFIKSHPLNGKKLFWFDDVSDRELAAIYAQSHGSIVASYAEGFGLPLIEALGYGTPVLARDLPVFRSHEENGVHYFPADADTATLSRAVKKWIERVHAADIEIIRPETSWSDSTRQLLEAIK